MLLSFSNFLGKNISNRNCFFSYPTFWERNLWNLRNFGSFPCHTRMSLEASKSFWCQGCQSPGRWQECRVLAGLILCVFFKFHPFKTMLSWYTYINLVGTFPSEHQINWQQLYKKGPFFCWDRVSFTHIKWRRRSFFVGCSFGVVCHKRVGSWCFLSLWTLNKSENLRMRHTSSNLCEDSMHSILDWWRTHADIFMKGSLTIPVLTNRARDNIMRF